MSEQDYKKAAKAIISAGVLPIPINDTMIEILKIIIDPNELDLVLAFQRKKSQTMEQLLKSTKGKKDENEILKKVESLAKNGVIFNQPNSQGVMVFRLLPLIITGVFEYQMMRPLEFSEKEKKLAKLYLKLFNELKEFVQGKYDSFTTAFKSVPPLDRTLPILGKNVEGNEVKISINEEIDAPQEEIVPTQKVEEIINKFDDIAVSGCFCRQHHDLLDDPCKINAPRENCFTFGKSARHIVNQGFGRMVTKEEALKIIKEAEDIGLVHKTYHPNSNVSRDETSLCNCCKCCCGTFNLYKDGVLPTVNLTNYLSKVDQNICIGCGTCVEKCPLDAISLNDDNKAEVDESRCLGCGICAHFCESSAISLLEGKRVVYIPPPKLKS